MSLSASHIGTFAPNNWSSNGVGYVTQDTSVHTAPVDIEQLFSMTTPLAQLAYTMNGQYDADEDDEYQPNGDESIQNGYDDIDSILNPSFNNQ
jgi:hypothetical protein